MAEPLRVDILLHRLCLTRSRNEAKVACESGAVLMHGRPARASQSVSAGDQVTIRFPHRTLTIRIDELPGKSTSKKVARELYHVVREEQGEPTGPAAPAVEPPPEESWDGSGSP